MSYVIPYAFFDPPLVIQCSVTPIPASTSLPLQVIANTGDVTGIGVDFLDTTGDFIGVYQGAAGHEQLLCVIGNGSNSQKWCSIPRYSRISLRAMNNKSITGGELVAALVTL